MQVAGIIKNSVVNGIGIRDVLFLQGCHHYCKGCHNPETWNPRDGRYMWFSELINEFKDSPHDITISGGEPLLQSNDVLDFMEYMNHFYNKRFWLYTGYTYEEIPEHLLLALSKYVDVLVDGRFEEDKKDLRLPFRGSSNQRLIDLPESVKEHKVVLWEGLNE